MCLQRYTDDTMRMKKSMGIREIVREVGRECGGKEGNSEIKRY